MVYKIVLLLHVLAATIWTGGHLILAVGFLPRALRAKDFTVIEQFEGPFEKLGIPALLIQILTGIWLAFRYLPEMSDWFGFDNYLSTGITLKFILLGLTLGLALHARLRLIPNISEKNMNYLAWHILSVTILSVLFVIVGVGIRIGGYF